jgi:hypothetical protein
MPPIRLAIVGLGRIARDRHVPAIAATAGIELAAIASRNIRRRQDAALGYTGILHEIIKCPQRPIVSRARSRLSSLENQTLSGMMADREGFEPPIPLRVCRISSAVHSTTLPPVRGRSGRSGLVTTQRAPSAQAFPMRCGNEPVTALKSFAAMLLFLDGLPMRD